MFIRYNSGSFLMMASLGLMMVSAILGQNDTISITTTLLNHPLLYSNDEVRVQCNGGSFGDQTPREFGLIFQGLQESKNYLCATAGGNLGLILSENSPIDSISPANDNDCRELVARNSFEFVFKPHQAGLTYWCYMDDGTIRRSRDETLPATIHGLPTDTQMVTDGENYYEGSTVTATCTVTGGVPTTATYQYSSNGQNFTSTGAQTFEAKRNMMGGMKQDIDCTSTEHLPYRDRSQPGLVGSKTINIYWLPTDTQLATDRDNYYEGWNVTATCTVTGGFPETTTYQYSFGGQTFNSTGLSSWTFEANRTMTGDISCTSIDHLLYRGRSPPGLVGSKTINIHYIDLKTEGVVQRVKNPNYNDSLDCRGFLDTNLPTTNLAYSWTGDGIADGTVTNEAVLRLPESEVNGTTQYTCDITGPKFRNTDPDQKRQVVVIVMWSLDAPPPFTTLPPLPITATLSPGAIGGIVVSVFLVLVAVAALIITARHRVLCFKRSRSENTSIPLPDFRAPDTDHRRTEQESGAPEYQEVIPDEHTSGQTLHYQNVPPRENRSTQSQSYQNVHRGESSLAQPPNYENIRSNQPLTAPAPVDFARVNDSTNDGGYQSLRLEGNRSSPRNGQHVYTQLNV